MKKNDLLSTSDVQHVMNFLQSYSPVAYVLVYLFSETGMSFSEATDLRVKDTNIFLKDKKISYYSNTYKQQIDVPIPESVFSAIFSLTQKLTAEQYSFYRRSENNFYKYTPRAWVTITKYIDELFHIKISVYHLNRYFQVKQYLLTGNENFVFRGSSNVSQSLQRLCISKEVAELVKKKKQCMVPTAFDTEEIISAISSLTNDTPYADAMMEIITQYLKAIEFIQQHI